MRRLTTVLALVAVMIIAGFGPLTAQVFAVEYSGVGGKPAHPQADNPRTQSIFVYTLKANSQKTDAVKVFNNTGETRTLMLDAVDSVLTSDGAFSCAQAVEPKQDVGSWLTLKQTNVVLPAQSSIEVPFTINAPNTASTGEHDGCITIQDVTSKTVSKQSGVVLSFRSALRVAITVPGKLVKNLHIENVTVTQNKDGNYVVTPLVYNGGNVSLDTNVKTSLNNVFNSNASGKAQTYPVLPKSRTSWNFELKRPFWGGWYRAAVSVAYSSNPKVSLGQTDKKQTTITAHSAVFFATPAPLAGALEIGILALLGAALVWILQRKRHSRRVRRHWQSHTVTNGETLQTIAKAHRTSWKKLATANRLKPPYHLEPGHKLKVPPKSED